MQKKLHPPGPCRSACLKYVGRRWVSVCALCAVALVVWLPADRVRAVAGESERAPSPTTFGGFRSIAADLSWLKTHVAWKARETDRTLAWIRRTVCIGSDVPHYRIHGARMVAFDFPEWETRGGDDPAVAMLRRHWARQAVEFLEEGRARFPETALFPLEIAAIAHHRLEDPETALNYYRIASSMPDAPFFAARMCAALLLYLGRDREAYDWLCALYPNLPKDDPRAMAPIVRRRIMKLEASLGVPAEKRFRANHHSRD